MASKTSKKQAKMRTGDETVLSAVLPPEERAIESVVARYRRVAPAVTRFARSISGNDELQVRLGSMSASGDNDVVVDPGVFQAAYARSAPVTPGEVALASALHEVVHLVATDLEERRPLPREWLPDDYEGELVETELSLLDAIREAGGPAAEALFFTLEDARQEGTLFTGYEGARSVLADLYTASVPGAMEQSRPLGQFALASFLIVGGYQDKDVIQRRVEPHVAGALDDAVAFLDDVLDADDPWVVAGLALQLLAVARMHGLVADAPSTEKPLEREAREAADAEQLNQGVDQVRLVSPILRDADGYDDTKGAAEAMAAPEGRRDDDAETGSDPATDQIVRISEAPTVHLPTGQGGKLIVSAIPALFASFGLEGRDALAATARAWGVAQRRVSGELHPLFAANQRRGLRSGYDAGDLSPHAALLLGSGRYERMFERRSITSRRSYAVSLLVDGSASMLQPRDLNQRRSPWAMAAATLGAWTLARMADELQVDFEVAIFNRSFAATRDDSEHSFQRRLATTHAGLRQTRGGAAERLSRTVNHYLVKSFDDRWRASEDLLAGLFWTAVEPKQAAMAARRQPRESPPVSMFEKAANVDEFNVSYAAQRLAKRNAHSRILVVLADGMTRGSVAHLSAAVSAVEGAGTSVLGIGIGDATVEAAYERNEVVEKPEELARAMVDGVRASLGRAIAAWAGDTWWGHGGEITYHRSAS